MNYKSQSSNPIRKLEDYFNRKKYSDNTIICYMKHIHNIRKYTNKDIYHITVNDINNYLTNCSNKSNSYINQVINASILFLKYGLNKNNFTLNKLERPRKETKLPRTIPEDYLLKCLSNIKNVKHKAILTLAYSVGLRRTEIINLKISDIDSENNQINIRQGKGKKDGNVPLREKVLILLKDYYTQYKPNVYLFNGQNNSPQYSATSLNKLVKKYIGKEYSFHNLRHSIATHLINRGVDISFIKKLLRHNNIKTTMIYLNVSTHDLNQLNYPI